MQDSKIDSSSALEVVLSQALDADLVVMESNGTELRMHDTSSSPGNYITHVVDVNITPVNNQVPFAEVNSHAKVQSPKTRNINKLIEPKVQASDLNVNKMVSADNTSGPALQRKERCMLQYAISLEEEKSSCLRPFSSTSIMLFHARSVIKNGHMTPRYISSGLMQNSVSPTSYVPLSKKDYEIPFQQWFDEYFNPPPHVVSLVLAADAALRAVDPASLLSSTTTEQDVPSASSLPTTYLLNAACKKALNLLKKGLLIRWEAVEASKRRRSLLDHKIQLLSKGSSEGSGIILETQAGTPPSMCQTILNIDAHVEGEQFHESKQSRVIRMVRLGVSSHDPARTRWIFPGTIL
uniref:Uncharacterized protein n=1 Tax=Tanacetum cinerariifolium TaxID=118510 RepID=A0A6L2LJ61_TANCI|nr:hypothetical protein [Tanacetum cinerariifolium]